MKINFWGNDPIKSKKDGLLNNTAFGIMPFIKVPTGSSTLTNNHVEGGVVFPFEMDLPWGFEFGFTNELDFVYNEDKDNYGISYVHIVNLSHDIPGINHLEGYIEYMGEAPHSTGDTYEANLDLGLTYEMSEDWTFGLGSKIGLSNSADDFSIAMGTAVRF